MTRYNINVRKNDMTPKNIYQSHWTKEKIKAFRATYRLSQHQLAMLIETPQQRVSEWENGVHNMKRSYSKLLDQLEGQLARLKKQAGTSKKKYYDLMFRAFGVDLGQSPGRPLKEKEVA